MMAEDTCLIFWTLPHLTVAITTFANVSHDFIGWQAIVNCILHILSIKLPLVLFKLLFQQTIILLCLIHFVSNLISGIRIVLPFAYYLFVIHLL